MQIVYWKSDGQTSADTETSEVSRRPDTGTSTSSAVASRASQSALLDGERVTPTVDGSGPSSSELFAFFGPGGSLSRMSPVYSQPRKRPSSRESSRTFTSAGMMRNGQLFRPKPSARRTAASESGLLPTSKGSAKNYGQPRKNARGDLQAAVMSRIYPSPRAGGRDNCGGSNSRRTAKANGTYIGRKLSPRFVEWMMGFPDGWTDLDVSETRSFHRSQSGLADS